MLGSVLTICTFRFPIRTLVPEFKKVSISLQALPVSPVSSALTDDRHDPNEQPPMRIYIESTIPIDLLEVLPDFSEIASDYCFKLPF